MAWQSWDRRHAPHVEPLELPPLLLALLLPLPLLEPAPLPEPLELPSPLDEAPAPAPLLVDELPCPIPPPEAPPPPSSPPEPPSSPEGPNPSSMGRALVAHPAAAVAIERRTIPAPLP